MKAKNIISSLFLLAVLLQLLGCEDQWNEHYMVTTERGKAGNGTDILNTLSTINECSEFYNALVINRFDTLIRDNFIYTVLAPTNDHFDLEQIPEELRLKHLLMHFTYGDFISNQIPGERLEMFSTKFLNFEKQGDSVIVDNYANILKADINCTNGVIHTIDTTLVYKRNVYEYMYEEFPFFAEHFDSKIVSVFDYINSEPTGFFDEYGQTIYDTVWVDVNTFLTGVADLTNEQSQYTLIIPTKEVIEQAMETDVSAYFGGVDNVPDIINKSILDGIIGNAVYPNAYTFDRLPDEMVSVVYQNQVIDKSAIFEKDTELSNGVLHKTSALKIDNSSFLNTIQIDFRDYVKQDRIDGSLDFYIENFDEVEGDNRHWNISNHSPESTDVTSLFANQNGIVIWNMFYEDEWIEFEIPNVLKTTYEIWFDPKGSYYRPNYLVQFRNEDGTWEEEQFEVMSHTYRGGKVMGTVSFESFGKKTIRFTAIPGSSGSRKNVTSLYELRLIPVTN